MESIQFGGEHLQAWGHGTQQEKKMVRCLESCDRIVKIVSQKNV